MTPAQLAAARREEWQGRDGEPLRPLWTELPPGVLRAFGWYARNTIDTLTAPPTRIYRRLWSPYPHA